MRWEAGCTGACELEMVSDGTERKQRCALRALLRAMASATGLHAKAPYNYTQACGYAYLCARCRHVSPQHCGEARFDSILRRSMCLSFNLLLCPPLLSRPSIHRSRLLENTTHPLTTPTAFLLTFMLLLHNYDRIICHEGV